MFAQNRFDNHGIRDDALKSFVKALQTDRMVAITGAMATEALGYPNLDEFTIAYALIADALAAEIIAHRGSAKENKRITTYALLRDIRKRAYRLIKDVRLKEDKSGQSKNSTADRRVSMWTLHELFRAVDRGMRQTRAGLVIRTRYQGSALEEFEYRVGAIFLSRLRVRDTKGMPASIRPLIRSLGIKRFATLNYDLELERALMLRLDERKLVTDAEETDRKKLPGKVANLNSQAPSAVRRRALRGLHGPTKAELYAVKHTLILNPLRWPASDGSPDVLRSVASFTGPLKSGKPIIRQDGVRLSRTMGDGIHVESDVVNRERPDRLFEFAIGSAEISRHILHIHGRADCPETMVANIRQYDQLYRLDDLYRDPFDHGLRMLIGGNPILFIGLGMNEAEINEKLQYFVSNTPIRRPAPLFLLWNRHPKQNDDHAWRRYKEDRRLDFRVRLGVYVIFDDDFEPLDRAPLQEPLESLPTMMSRLPQLIERIDRRVDRHPDKWRSIERRLAQSSGKSEPCRMWGSDNLFKLRRDATEKRFILPPLEGSEEDEDFPPLIFASSDNGFGRGELSEYIAWSEQRGFRLGNSPIAPSTRVNRLLVNAGFSYDSDAMLSGIARFLAMRAVSEPTDVTFCREQHFAKGDLLKMAPHTLIIINGADRFFGSDGAPLSAEFDHFLRCVHAHGTHLQVLLLCTARMRVYSQALGYTIEPLALAGVLPPDRTPDEIPLKGVTLRSSYLGWVSRCYDQLARERPTVDPAEMRPSEASVAMMRRAELIDRDAQKRTFFEAYLMPPLLSALGVDCPATFEVLRTLSFIGTPVEGVVLLYAPKVRAILAEERPPIDGPTGSGRLPTEKYRTDAHDEAYIRQRLAMVLRDLRKLGLLIELDPHDPQAGSRSPVQSPQRDVASAEAHNGAQASSEGIDDNTLWCRYGMHRSLATFLRDRHGAPINDAKLATTFNMSMFMSEPSDSTTPETMFHDELGDLADTLAGAWHDIKEMQSASDLALSDLDPDLAQQKDKLLGEKWHELFTKIKADPGSHLADISIKDLYIAADDESRAIKNLPWHAHRDAAACLRGALSVVRGYYSTGALLRFDRSDRGASPDRDGALTEHARRLDRLISVFGDIAVSRSMLQRAAADILDKRRREDKQARRDPTATERASIAFAKAIGPEPFYGDDLVWLFNERATVALAQGNLFEAREALSAADRVNTKHVERHYHGHNWRRIALGRVAIRIERGSLKPAERLLDDIEVAVNVALWCKQSETGDGTRINRIRALAGTDNVMPLHGSQEFTREEIFIVAMTTGYRGLIAHLRGRYHEANGFYQVSVRMLRQLGEQRAYAHFQRHWATLEGFFGDKMRALREIDHAISAAQAARQMDILHRARVVRADLIRETEQDEAKRRNALQDIKEALRYAALADCYRVRIEASASLARHMRIGGDYDTALRYGVDAMTIAARYGHSLQKTSLRIELGRILEARGDPISGRALLDQAVEIGTGKGYHHALERVRRALNPAPSTNWTYIKTNE